MSPMQTRKWWKEATAYQIWPASFQDSNDDGFGDIPGITTRLDYLRDLGVDLVWLSPVYDSPQHDMGYDISDYENIWAKYGTLADMDRLIRELKKRNMKIIMDLVLNHTSSEHKWFIESSKSADPSNPYHDWYHWRDPKGYDDAGNPLEPNNWRAAFGGSVWTFVPARKQFYLHLALPEQPDLNWFNSAARRAAYDSAIEFWLKRGIDGFRVDVVNFYWKDLSFPDARILEPNEKWQAMEPQHIINGPMMHPWLQEQRKEVLDKYGEDIIMVGELPGTDRAETVRYLDPKNRELDMIFDLDIFMAGNSFGSYYHQRRKAKLTEIKTAIAKSQSLLADGKGWATTLLENHDHARSIDHFGPGSMSEHRVAAGRMLALLTVCLSGTIFLFQGQELGMTNIQPTWRKEDFRDRATLDYLESMRKQYPEDADMQKKAFAAALTVGRDNARTPVQWNSSLHAGFSNSQPWISVNSNYTEVNAERQTGDSTSVLEFWRRLLQLRKQYKDTLIYGDFEVLEFEDEEKITFTKRCADSGQTILVDLNFTDGTKPAHALPVSESIVEKVLISSHPTSTNINVGDDLQPWEGRVHILR